MIAPATRGPLGAVQFSPWLATRCEPGWDLPRSALPRRQLPGRTGSPPSPQRLCRATHTRRRSAVFASIEILRRCRSSRLDATPGQGHVVRSGCITTLPANPKGPSRAAARSARWKLLSCSLSKWLCASTLNRRTTASLLRDRVRKFKDGPDVVVVAVIEIVVRLCSKPNLGVIRSPNPDPDVAWSHVDLVHVEGRETRGLRFASRTTSGVQASTPTSDRLDAREGGRGETRP